MVVVLKTAGDVTAAMGYSFVLERLIITINAISLLYAYIITLLEKKASLQVDLVEPSLHWP